MLGHYLHSISPCQGIVPLGTCTISLLVTGPQNLIVHGTEQTIDYLI